eukprot:CAMPEP_0113894242 /NCGR_PEP_ID=MMETSP0780_2-20120614/16589_1 /TAXON_ID=652834 /ORGANISM="Palpitomonas bilix" /LENGTH=427 /DNA_ID=CAMNT_0000884721 /DNA_START=61 /DNA_END=1344 /DNA_ORIENTATION=- /assembly_acc=CAM_ASM_000599
MGTSKKSSKSHHEQLRQVTARQYGKEALRLCVAQILLEQGASGANDKALATVTDAAEQLLTSLGGTARDFAFSAGRTQINYADCLEACVAQGLQVADITTQLSDCLESRAAVVAAESKEERLFSEGKGEDGKGGKTGAKGSDEIELLGATLQQFQNMKGTSKKRLVKEVVQNAVDAMSVSKRRKKGSYVTPIQCEDFPRREERPVLQEDDFDEALKFFLRATPEAKPAHTLEKCVPLPPWMPKRRSLPPFPPKHTFDRQPAVKERILQGKEGEKEARQLGSEIKKMGEGALRSLKHKLGDKGGEQGFDASMTEQMRRKIGGNASKQDTIISNRKLEKLEAGEKMLVRAAQEKAQTTSEATMGDMNEEAPPSETELPPSVPSVVQSRRQERRPAPESMEVDEGDGEDGDGGDITPPASPERAASSEYI